MIVDTVTLAMTGASGAPYGLRLLECLVAAGRRIYFLASKPAQLVIATETDFKLPARPDAMAHFLTERFGASPDQIVAYGPEQWSAPIASGSGAARAMVVCPCSSGTLSSIAHGASKSLLERAADVMLKERRTLILVHRETPLSLIHVENMRLLLRAGATLLPANPGFYHRPQTVDELVDFVVARVLDQLGLEQALVPRWGADAQPPDQGD